jgi:hypothetical protein
VKHAHPQIGRSHVCSKRWVTASFQPSRARPGHPRRGRRRRLILAVIATAQLMAVLDEIITNHPVTGVITPLSRRCHAPLRACTRAQIP